MSAEQDKSRTGNENRSNRNRGSQGDDGRRRGRGRGQRNQGRGGRNQDKVQTNEASEKKKTSGVETLANFEQSKHSSVWFQEALENLGHFNPSSVIHAIETDNDEETTADDQLASLTMWLEDRLIRSW